MAFAATASMLPASMVGAQAAPSLPLSPGEQVVPFANGCGMVSPAGRVEGERRWAASRRWLGPCRFGLAHGDGFLKAGASPAEAYRFQYGTILGGVDRRGGAPYNGKVGKAVFMALQLEDGGMATINVPSAEIDAHMLNSSAPVVIGWPEPAGLLYDSFDTKVLDCSSGQPIDWSGVTISEADRASAAATCTPSSRGGGSGMMGGLLGAVAGARDVWIARHAHHRVLPGGAKVEQRIDVTVCQPLNCPAAFDAMFAPHRARIQQVIDGQRRQYAQGLPWLAQRFAPLEADLRRRHAARLAAIGVKP